MFKVWRVLGSTLKTQPSLLDMTKCKYFGGGYHGFGV
jgi:hypothetical protein